MHLHYRSPAKPTTSTARAVPPSIIARTSGLPLDKAERVAQGRGSLRDRVLAVQALERAGHRFGRGFASRRTRGEFRALIEANGLTAGLAARVLGVGRRNVLAWLDPRKDQGDPLPIGREQWEALASTLGLVEAWRRECPLSALVD